MNILFHLHAYPPEVFAGAETMAHRIAKFLQSKGHNIKVFSQASKEKVQFFDKVEVLSFQGQDDSSIWRWADLVITHLGGTYHCLNQARKFKKNLVHLIHNSFGDHILRTRVKNNYVVYNSEYVKRVLKYTHQSIVCIPPVDYREYKDLKKGEHITLVNLNENKGGKIFIEIAKRLPQYKFLGVTGGYYEQNKEVLPNLTYIPQQTDIKKAYTKTKVVLMPSEYESWGQVGIEALSCGIPVISSKAQGLTEALSYAGTSVDRSDIGEWCKSIIDLMTNESLYKQKSEQAIKRAKELDPVPYLENLNNFLIKVNTQPYNE